MDTDTELQPQDAPLGRLPFTFAKRNGVILTRDDDGDPVILVRPGPDQWEKTLHAPR